MYTDEDVINAYKEIESNDSDFMEFLKTFEEERTVSIQNYEAKDIMEEMGVDYCQERIDWYNLTELDIDDILRLSNVDFVVRECDMCQSLCYEGLPDDLYNFRGVMPNDYTIVILNDDEKVVCESCYSEHPTFFN